MALSSFFPVFELEVVGGFLVITISHPTFSRVGVGVVVAIGVGLLQLK